MKLSLDLASLRNAYENKRLHPREVVREVYHRIELQGNTATWIHLVPEEDAVRRLEMLDPALPLYGVPFAVKDNIDVASHPTTAACPAYACTAEEDATVVARLSAAGAVLIGKTNMDQFATGLVGVRSPYGAVKNAFDPSYISGGSSAGSAVAVATGLVSFSLGTDTAGSGRVPAAFNNLVGLKPTRGLVSATGVVPACQSLDCVSVFALTVEDAYTVLECAAGFDAADPYSRRKQSGRVITGSFRFGVPAPEQLQTFTDLGYRARYKEAIKMLEQLGGLPVEVDFSPFRETAELLYGGPWVSERVSAIETFYRNHKDDLHPVLQTILENAARYSAADVFRAMHRLEVLRRETEKVWADVDILVTPTISRIFTVKEVEEDPIELNSQLGYYTNFVNLLDLCALALPAGFGDNGLPFGVTLTAPAWHEPMLGRIGRAFQHANALPLGATEHALPQARLSLSTLDADSIRLAVFGAHLSGQPLNHQLTDLGARLVGVSRTAPAYRLYALNDSQPAKPGLVRNEQGAAIETEIWQVPLDAFGGFVALVPAPLTVGTVELDDGTFVKGFLCESWAAETARDITSLGGWRAYLGEG